MDNSLLDVRDITHKYIVVGESKKFSAIYLALRGSPGIKTVFAISPLFAEFDTVPIKISP